MFDTFVDWKNSARLRLGLRQASGPSGNKYNWKQKHPMHSLMSSWTLKLNWMCSRAFGPSGVEPLSFTWISRAPRFVQKIHTISAVLTLFYIPLKYRIGLHPLPYEAAAPFLFCNLFGVFWSSCSSKASKNARAQRTSLELYEDQAPKRSI